MNAPSWHNPRNNCTSKTVELAAWRSRLGLTVLDRPPAASNDTAHFTEISWELGMADERLPEATPALGWRQEVIWCRLLQPPLAGIPTDTGLSSLLRSRSGIPFSIIRVSEKLCVLQREGRIQLAFGWSTRHLAASIATVGWTSSTVRLRIRASHEGTIKWSLIFVTISMHWTRQPRK